MQDQETIPIWDCRRDNTLAPRGMEVERACPVCGRPMTPARLFKKDVTPRTFYLPLSSPAKGSMPDSSPPSSE